MKVVHKVRKIQTGAPSQLHLSFLLYPFSFRIIFYCHPNISSCFLFQLNTLYLCVPALHFYLYELYFHNFDMCKMISHHNSILCIIDCIRKCVWIKLYWSKRMEGTKGFLELRKWWKWLHSLTTSRFSSKIYFFNCLKEKLLYSACQKKKLILLIILTIKIK